jgi:hypothetical protein
MQSYVVSPKKAKYRTIQTTQFPETWNRERNALKSAYHAKSKIGWENLVKGAIAQEWIQFTETHYMTRATNSKPKIGHQHVLVLYGNIHKGCGNSGTQFTMLTKTDE